LDLQCAGYGPTTIIGSDRANRILLEEGETGVSTLSGLGGDDVIRGAGGADSIDGGDDSDRCFGGPGVSDVATDCEFESEFP
jgi:hypothetical protein